MKIKKLIIVCRKNFYYIQEFQKNAYNKSIKAKTVFLIIKFDYISNISK